MAKVEGLGGELVVVNNTRRDMHPGDIYRDSHGNHFLAFGNHDTFLAIDGDGNLLDGVDPAEQCVKIGSFQFAVRMERGLSEKDVVRSELPHNAVFRTANGSKLYANLGVMSDGRFAAVDLDHPYEDNYVVGTKADKGCVQVGTYTLEALKK